MHSVTGLSSFSLHHAYKNCWVPNIQQDTMLGKMKSDISLKEFSFTPEHSDHGPMAQFQSDGYLNA